MLVPQYSIRWLLALTAACGVVSSIFGLAVRGSHWAQAVSIAIIALVVVLLIHAFFFTLVWVFSVVTARSRRTPVAVGRSPFAHDPSLPGPTQSARKAGDKDVPATPGVLD